MRIKQSFYDYVLLTLLIVVFSTTDTIYELPKGPMLRWIILFLLVGLHIAHVMIKGKGRIKYLPDAFIYLFFPLIIQSFWNFESIGLALSRSISFLIYAIAIYAFFTRVNTTSNRIYKVYSFFAVFLVLFVMVLNLANINNYSLNGDFYGIFANRTVTSCVLLSTIVLLLNLSIQSDNKLIRFFFGILFLLAVYMLFTTHSRMAFIGFALIIILFSLSIQGKNAVRSIIAFMLLVLILFMTPLIGQRFNISAINRVFAANNSVSSNGLIRNVWLIGFKLFSQHPLFGWGNNTVYYYTFVNPTNGVWGVHNSYLIMLIEGGVVGVVFYILFFVRFFKTIYRNYIYCRKVNISKKESLFVKISLIVCAVLALNAISESFLFSAGNIEALPFWFTALGVYEYLARKKTEAEQLL